MKYQCTRCGRRTLMSRCVRCNINTQPVNDNDNQDTYNASQVAVNTAVWGFDYNSSSSSDSSSCSSDSSSCSSD